MKKKLTYRQQQFLRKFVEIHRAMGQPVHYITVAEQMGVGNVTSYEMLRLLEERGFLQAEYHPNPDQHGPGRSVVLFYPTESGEKLVESLPQVTPQDEDWDVTRDQLLGELENIKPDGYEGWMSNLLSHLSEDSSPLTYATKLVTSIVITLVSLKDIPAVRSVLERLSRVGLPQEISLNVFSGITMFLSIWDRTNKISASFLSTQMDRFENVISHLSEESKRKLSDYTRDLIRILSG
jgi:hypothetical protein